MSTAVIQGDGLAENRLHSTVPDMTDVSPGLLFVAGRLFAVWSAFEGFGVDGVVVGRLTFVFGSVVVVRSRCRSLGGGRERGV